MKTLFRKSAALCLLACALASAFPVVSLAAPSAEASISLLSAEVADGEKVITVNIVITVPSEPYASLDFNLITSNHENLSIIDLDDDPEITSLDISFAKGYGNAYHSGQNDESTGGYRYLIGIYSQRAGNNITDDVSVCSVRLRYSGDEPETLQIRDMKLVYIDSAGDVVSSPVASDNAKLTVDGSFFSNEPLTETSEILAEEPVPLSDAPVQKQSWIFYLVCIALAAAVSLNIVQFVKRHRKIKS